MAEFRFSRQRLDSVIEAALSRTPQLRHVQSILVLSRGNLVFERYFRDRVAADLSNVHSVTKRVVASLAGIAIGEGHVELSTRVSDVLDLVLTADDPRKSEITVEHLLTMTSGLDADTPYDIDEIADRGESWVEGPLAAPLRAEPGTTFIYNNGAVHVLARIRLTADGVRLRRRLVACLAQNPSIESLSKERQDQLLEILREVS